MRFADVAFHNDHFASDVVKASVSFLRDESSEEAEELHLVFKLPPSNVLKYAARAMRIFRHEVLWYTRYLPLLRSPEAGALVPRVLHGYVSNEGDGPLDGDSIAKLACGVAFRRSERGILIMEDLTKYGFSALDQTEVVGLDRAMIVMSALATFHGEWWQALNPKWKVKQNAEVLKDFKYNAHT